MSPQQRSASRVPRATYRIQLTPSHGFSAAAELVPYLDKLGVSHCYLSPYLKTRPASEHGYDVIDHEALNTELGAAEEFEQLCDALEQHGMQQLADIVPNHVGVMGSDSVWWLDVLENGQASRYADYFDIDWRPVKAELRNRVLVPVLGDHYGNVLLGGELELKHDEQTGEYSVYYYQHRFPLDPASYPTVLQGVLQDLAAELPADAPELMELESIIRSLEGLPHHSTTDDAQREVRSHEQTAAKRRLTELGSRCASAQRSIERRVTTFNGTPHRRETFEALHALLEQQPYRLAYWRVAADEINYRRFFDINDLAALRTQNVQVLEATHKLLLARAAAGKIHGFRIDHPDGLYDPRGYLRWLERRLASVGRPNRYLIVEKILASHEYLAEDWPVDGTTGYDFSAAVTGLFVYSPAERGFDRVYRDFTGQREDYESMLYGCKREVIMYQLSSELTVLANLLDQIAEARIDTRDFTLNAVRDALLEMVASFPVYRSYIADGNVSEQDRQHVEWAVAQAQRRYNGRDEGIFELIRRLLLQEVPVDAEPAYRRLIERFTAKFQQLTAPVMAKAMEDTCFYRYVRLLSLNEVGGDPKRFGVTPSAFHHLAQMRAQRWPHSMLNTSTHDSKRSEDVRARINVLSEIPDLWRARLAKWRRFNQSKRRRADDRNVPSRSDEYLLYQTLVGSWPVPFSPDILPDYCARIEQYMVKAVREAKVNTSWMNPHANYEERMVDFVRDVLSVTPSNSVQRNQFIADLNGFVELIALPGYLNSLAQTLLKLTAPGVPDIYQGNELWDFSLVDPDNRRPVDYELRRRLLAEVQAEAAAPNRAPRLVAALSENIEDGRAKLYLTWRTLELRRAQRALFDEGTYLPLEIRGPEQEHVCAFARQHGGRTLVVAVGRWFTKLVMRAHDAPTQATARDGGSAANAGAYSRPTARDGGSAANAGAHSRPTARDGGSAANAGAYSRPTARDGGSGSAAHGSAYSLRWNGTELVLPRGGEYENVLTGERMTLSADPPVLSVQQLLSTFPAALLFQATAD
jgi:(1->4)-alpha-D-glucan 1-alpha-D-glucosylmutase